MKKFLFSIIAVGAIVACTKSEVKYDEPSEIAFAPVASTATKAAIDGNVYPTDIPFNVFSFYAVDVEPGAVQDYSQFTKTYLDNKVFRYYSESGLFGGKDHAYYWPKTGSLVFAGYSPDASTLTSASQAYDFTNGLTITDYVQSDNTQNTKDLMWFNHTAYSYRGYVGVPVTFRHACSWISFYVTSHTPDAAFRVKKIVLNDVKVKGTLNAKPGVDPTWSLTADTKPIVVMSGDVEVPSNHTQVKVDDDGVIVLPQECVSATITYTMNNGAGVVIEQTQTFNLSAGINGANWLYGRHYTYTIKFSADQILISPNIEDWTEVSGDMVVVD